MTQKVRSCNQTQCIYPDGYKKELHCNPSKPPHKTPVVRGSCRACKLNYGSNARYILAIVDTQQLQTSMCNHNFNMSLFILSFVSVCPCLLGSTAPKSHYTQSLYIMAQVSTIFFLIRVLCWTLV